MRAFKGTSEIVEDLAALERARTVKQSSLNPQQCLAQLKRPGTLPKGFAPPTKAASKGKRRKGKT